MQDFSPLTRDQIHVSCIGSMASQPLDCQGSISCFYFFNILFKIFIYFFLVLAVLGLCCFTQAFCSRSEQGLLFIAMCGLLIAVASLVVGHRL